MFFIVLLVVVIVFVVNRLVQEEPPIRIGATMSETGAYSTQGTAARNGYLLFEKHINEKGGILGRDVEFIIYNDKSDSDTAIKLYEKLITEDEVDLIMGPYGSTLTEAVAPVTEKHNQVHISPLAATTSIWEQGREYLFMVLPPAELFLAGLIEMGHEEGLTRVGVIQEDELFPKAAGTGAADLAREKGMEVLIHETYTSGTEDFSNILKKVQEENIEVMGMAASALGDFITVVSQMKELDVNVKMFGTSGAVDDFQQELGEAAEYVYGLSAWEPTLPYPGIDEFVESYREKFDMEPSFHAAGGYGSCMILREAIEKAGTLDSDMIRDELLELETQTIFGNFAVDERGYQIANTGVIIQWQDGKRAVVWPEEFATAEPRYPAPRWSER